MKTRCGIVRNAQNPRVSESFSVSAAVIGSTSAARGRRLAAHTRIERNTHMPTTLLRARWVIASDGASHHILEDGEVIYTDERIVFTGHDYSGSVDTVIDAGNAVIGPGFVDLDALFDLDSTVLGFDN